MIHNYYHVLTLTKKLKVQTEKNPNNFISKSDQTVLTYESYSSDPESQFNFTLIKKENRVYKKLYYKKKSRLRHLQNLT